MGLLVAAGGCGGGMGRTDAGSGRHRLPGMGESRSWEAQHRAHRRQYCNDRRAVGGPTTLTTGSTCMESSNHSVYTCN